ncbi:PREDICTED: CCAAT/enhancer-binding protein zeta isoform X2 [Eufriesea mexicana]|uniref:CCAAT/enhancer-binding protein zeta isoform X2 n=1 Tax=Eufriesea mexicana TaxID=516756 RepID=UPI00083BF1E0|nr:PREDICTED: CCAAT/enhancer-binding protein zeta isoform X2 [Eufriesea mexicana]
MKKGFTEMNKKSNKWYEEYSKGEEPYKHSISEAEISSLKDEAKKYLDAETSVFQLKESKYTDSETVWLRTALTQGTTSDKVAAAIVLVQDNPKYNLARLTMLINQVRVVKHNQCNMIIKSLKDLFLLDLLHPKFKLLKFEEQNLNEVNKFISEDTLIKSNISRKKLMAHWYFEDQLCELYERFVMSLATIASDTVDANREVAISVMTDLLIGNAEQEHKLLEFLVNKIGDPSSKIGSKVIFCLNKLLHEHPNMKLVVLREVEKLLFRKNVAQRAQYYAICLLTQLLLNNNDEKIASTLIEVYFAFFKACLKRGEPDCRMMAAILTGVNRAYPFAKLDSNILNDHIDSVYKVVHIGSLNVSFNALNLLYQITGENDVQSNRFYSAFYRKLLDPQIGVANKRALFLNLLYRVLQNDHNKQRLYSFIKRSLQVALYFPANMACATLYVISKILHTHKELKTLLLKPVDYIKVENEDLKFKDSSSNPEISYLSNDESKLGDSIVLTNVISEDNVNNESKIKAEKNMNININTQKEYDPFCRNPAYAGITKGLNTELIALSKHYHPSVALFANTILEGKSIDYTGDPLADLSLMRFLDRYVFKNPKKLENKKVQKKNDPLAQRAGYTPKGIRCIPVDSVSYINEKEERIPVDELYLYRYLKKRKKSKHEFKVDDDVESVNSEEFDDMLNRLTDGKDFEDLDIAADIQTSRKKKDIKEENNDFDDATSIESEASDSNDMYDLDYTKNLDEDSDTDAELQNLSDIDLNIDDDDDDTENILSKKTESNINKWIKKQDKKQNKKNKNSKEIDTNLFLSAEKFAEILEEHSKQPGKSGGTDTFNTDGASHKQIEWEIKRHQKLNNSTNRNKRKGAKSLKKNAKRMKY